MRYFLSQAPYVGRVFIPDVQPGRGLGREGDQGDSSNSPWGWSTASQPCSLSAAGGEGLGIPRAEGWLGNPSPSLRVLLVPGAVFAAVRSNFNVTTEEQHIVGKISNTQG